MTKLRLYNGPAIQLVARKSGYLFICAKNSADAVVQLRRLGAEDLSLHEFIRDYEIGWGTHALPARPVRGVFEVPTEETHGSTGPLRRIKE